MVVANLIAGSEARCASVPNVRILEVDVDDVPLMTAVPEIVVGAVAVATERGSGADVDEDVRKACRWPR